MPTIETSTAKRKLLLVCGSRSLAEDPDKTEWAKSEIEKHLSQLTTSDIVISGGADGPDCWARQYAIEHKITIVEYRLDGFRWVNDKKTDQRWDSEPGVAHHSKLVWPLFRNVRMIAACEVSALKGWDVKGIAISDPESPTKGTSFTAEEMNAKDSFHRESGKPGLPCSVYHWVPPFVVPAPTSNLLIRAPGTPPVEIVGPTILAWTDIETGGFAHTHPIIEIATILTDSSGKKVFGSFETKIKPSPGEVVEAQAAEVNGYTPQGWFAAPFAADALSKYREFLPARFQLAGYNVTFDRNFLLKKFQKHSIPEPGWTPTNLDLLGTIRKTLKNRKIIPNAKLSTVCDYFGISNSGAHGAMADVERARLSYIRLMENDLPASRE